MFSMATKHKVPPILWTILCLVILSFGATPYEKTMNIVLIVVRLTLLLIFSVLVVREWWKYQHRSQWSDTESDAGHDLLRRWRRWATGEHPGAVEPASHIVQGGCYHGSPLRPMKRSFSWMLVAAIIMVAIAFFMWCK